MTIDGHKIHETTPMLTFTFLVSVRLVSSRLDLEPSSAGTLAFFDDWIDQCANTITDPYLD